MRASVAENAENVSRETQKRIQPYVSRETHRKQLAAKMFHVKQLQKAFVFAFVQNLRHGRRAFHVKHQKNARSRHVSRETLNIFKLFSPNILLFVPFRGIILLGNYARMMRRQNAQIIRKIAHFDKKRAINHQKRR